MAVPRKRRLTKKPRPKSGWPKRLRDIRDDYDLSQAEAAGRIKVSQQIWSAWEAGRKAPSDSIAMLIDLVFPKK